jgi:hypothetical protein
VLIRKRPAIVQPPIPKKQGSNQAQPSKAEGANPIENLPFRNKTVDPSFAFS